MEFLTGLMEGGHTSIELHDLHSDGEHTAPLEQKPHPEDLHTDEDHSLDQSHEDDHKTHVVDGRSRYLQEYDHYVISPECCFFPCHPVEPGVCLRSDNPLLW